MPVRTETCYYAECDKCGQRCPPPGFEYSSWNSRDGALQCAEDSEYEVNWKTGECLCFKCAHGRASE